MILRSRRVKVLRAYIYLQTILIGTWKDAGTLTESGNVVENAKAINAGTETNNNIGRHA